MNIRSLHYLIFILAIGFFASVADLALGRAGLMPVQPTYLALATLLGVSLSEALFTANNSADQQARIYTLAQNKTVLVLYTVVAVISVIAGMLPEALWVEGGKWIFLIPLGLVLWVATVFIAGTSAFSSAGLLGVRLAWAGLIGSTIYEMFFPATFSNLAARPAGFAGNANFGALASSMLCAASLYYRPHTHLLRDLGILSATFIAVVATQSRSGLLEFLVVGIFWGASLISQLRRSPVKLLKTALLMGVAAVTLALGLVTVFTQSEVFSNQSSRFSRILSGKDVDDGSGDERLSAAADTLRHIAESPIIGYGTGFSRTLETFPHNIYLQQWVNNGLLGVLSYLAMLIWAGVIFSRGRYLPGFTFISVTIVGGFFSHNILDQKSFILPFAILLASSASLIRERRSIPVMLSS
jgi:O-antigen ligase